MDATWIQSGFELNGQHVGVSVRQLTADEHRRLAAEIAWFMDEILMVQKTSPSWRPIIERILSRDVTVTLNEEQLKGDSHFWDELICRLFQTFVAVNCLDAAIRQHLMAARELA